MKRLLISLFCVMLAGPALAEQAPHALPPGAGMDIPAPIEGIDPKIMQIFDRFFLSLVAASHCSQPLPQQLQSFSLNAKQVELQTVKHLLDARPEADDAEVRAQLNARLKLLDAATQQRIGREGCNEPYIAGLVKLFPRYADPQLFLRD